MSYVPARRSRRLARAGTGAGPARPMRGRKRTVSVVPRPLQGRYRYSRPDFEKKFLDTDLGTIDTVGQALEKVNLNVVPQGDAESERNGRKITVRNIYVKGTLKLNAATAATSTSTVIGLMIVVDTQTNGAAFAATDLLEADEWVSYRNLANQTRFKVLWKKDISLSSSGATATGAAYAFGENIRAFKKGIKCNIPIEYDNSATTGAVATQRVNSIHFVAHSTKNNLVTLDGTARIRFTDA